MEQVLCVRMFGKLTLTYNDKQISADLNRSKNVWNLLAYIIYNRSRVVSADELAALLRAEEKGCVNPTGALKTAVFRVRSLLNLLGDGMGHSLLRSVNGGYIFAPDTELTVDREQFDTSLEKAVTQGDNASLDDILEALKLYNGNFCSMQSSETWVMPISVYYQNKFAQLLQIAVPLLEKSERYADGIDLCKKAIETDPYSESFYQYLMRLLLALGKRDEVISLYENMRSLLLSTFGVMPDRESRTLYREALRTVNINNVTPESFIEQLKEEYPISGALVCDYDFFKNIYQSRARMLLRSKNDIHLVIITTGARLGKDISKKSVELAMDNLEKHLAQTLRKGDCITRCSSMQFAVMLPMASYENSCGVCERVISAFSRKYPHSPIKIDYTVRAVEPTAVG